MLYWYILLAHVFHAEAKYTDRLDRYLTVCIRITSFKIVFHNFRGECVFYTRLTLSSMEELSS